ncbi:MAG: FecR domain-containing protein [Treponema sp.]|jgi:hypothetical protein|nr:FecR domain-containing protein [Treponema sp.]
MKKQWLCAAVLAAWTGFAAYAQNGVIKELTGVVELKNAGAAIFTVAKIGDEVAPNTVVSTGIRSMATIEVGSAHVIVRPFTLLTMGEIARNQGTETVSMNLRTGRVHVDVKPPSGSKAEFTVESAHATASVRGTSFELDTRNLHVNNGTVQYQGTGGVAVAVSAGGASRVNATTGAVTASKEAYQAELLPTPPVSGPPVEPQASGGAAGSVSGPPAGMRYDLSLDLAFD